MPAFKKTILRVGTYKSGDQTVEVTPERLKHWASMHNKLKRNGQVVPVEWDHIEDPTKATPLSIDDFNKKRTAKNTIGHLKQFKVNKDGQSAEIVLSVRRTAANDAANNNLVAVSPVIFETWTDGHGNEYNDVITHMDFVNHPVDHSQGPFVKMSSIRMGLDQGKPLVYKFAMDGSDEEEDEDDEIDEDEILELGDDDEFDDIESDAIDDVPQLMEEAKEVFADINIAAPVNVNIVKEPAEFLKQMIVAGRQKKMDEDSGDDLDLEDDLEDDELFDEGDEEVEVITPDFAAMSLQVKKADKKTAAIEKRFIKMSKDSLGKKLDDLLSHGRVTADECKKAKSFLSTVKMNLGGDGEVQNTEIHHLIKFRSGLPEGAVWGSEEKLAMAIAQPSHVKGEVTTKEDAKKIVDEQVKRHAGMFNNS